ncbi:hypothetical protein A5624_10625 [Mycobacterium sp. 1482292.6]|uniref:hypothetical protein n=1 Tax=unclassified Mycobacterium TaxID=2642494 RepID=UPI000800EFF7|nr:MULTISPECIES: hypothetical protein [unclassified Mycobacterium]OBJ12693.1 hypothetical protein A5624_10625 [Mycobacterium sp. 1482292.6]OBJ24812.1 hypothetical protein A5622_11195 [Mycobacterium sp. 1245801.1]
MTLKLDPGQAPVKLGQIEDARQNALKALHNIHETQTTMLTSGWQGGSATKYGNLSATQHDDITTIINNLNQIVDTAKAQINAVQNADQG